MGPSSDSFMEEGAVWEEAVLRLVRLYYPTSSSLQEGLQVTEQGDNSCKLGLSSIAIKTFALYTSAIIQANLLEPPKPKPEWRQMMGELSKSCAEYEEIVGDSKFVSYFRHATPEGELANLPLGSRPARRKSDGGIEVRAIPWIFAWSQNRLMLPAWLGAGDQLQAISLKIAMIKEMIKTWPFFGARLSMFKWFFEIRFLAIDIL